MTPARTMEVSTFDLCSVQYVADRAKVEHSAVSNWVKKGEIVPVRWRGSSTLLYWPEVFDFLVKTGRMTKSGKPKKANRWSVQKAKEKAS